MQARFPRTGNANDARDWPSSRPSLLSRARTRCAGATWHCCECARMSRCSRACIPYARSSYALPPPAAASPGRVYLRTNRRVRRAPQQAAARRCTYGVMRCAPNRSSASGPRTSSPSSGISTTWNVCKRMSCRAHAGLEAGASTHLVQIIQLVHVLCLDLLARIAHAAAGVCGEHA